jgi:hypothetical protein
MDIAVHVEKMGTFEPEHLAVLRNETHRARAEEVICLALGKVALNLPTP